MTGEPGLRFTDLLTTAAAVANYLGEPVVSAAHVLSAIRIQLGEIGLDELGRPRSPLGRPPHRGDTVEPRLRALVQLWYERIGGQVTAELDATQLDGFRSALEALAAAPDTEAG